MEVGQKARRDTLQRRGGAGCWRPDTRANRRHVGGGRGRRWAARRDPDGPLLEPKWLRTTL
eukprot:8557738-Lingulodinium_polyedra.AAC.1